MSAKHTPGPWQAKNDVMDWDEIIGNIDGPSDGEYSYRYIATVTTDHDYGEGRANARLIAAAPELLEALDACRSWLTNGEFDSSPFVRDLRQRVSAAIAKATGAQP